MPSKPIPVRLTPDTIARLDGVAGVAGLDRSDVIKLCLSRFLDELDANPAELLNRDWKSLLKKQDGRVLRYSRPESPGLSVVADAADAAETPSPQPVDYRKTARKTPAKRPKKTP